MYRVMLAASFFLSIFFTNGCSPLFTQDVQQAACRQLKSDIIFNGATFNDRQVEIERSQRPLLERSYEMHCS